MKPLLTMKMKAKRMKFVTAYQHFTSEDWAKVMFSDESTPLLVHQGLQDQGEETGRHQQV